jgi:hypothetical protein
MDRGGFGDSVSVKIVFLGALVAEKSGILGRHLLLCIALFCHDRDRDIPPS